MSVKHRVIEYRGGKKVAIVENQSQPSRIGKAPFTLRELFQTVFLPDGFPGSVSEDYIEYQVWDSLQALFSSICGSLATRAILEGIGVGDTSATALAATFTWLVRDGASMIGRIVFAAAKGRELDANCKQWRLFADILNDVSMALEITAPIIFTGHSKLIFCIAAVGKSIVGVAGGATRAALTHHQAMQGNFADVAAKDGSQETLVNLAALLLSFVCLPFMTQTNWTIWISFVLLATLHIYSNYRAVSSLKINRLNRHRLNMIIDNYTKFGKIPTVDDVNKSEPLFYLGRGKEQALFGLSIEMAAPTSCIPLEEPLSFFSDDSHNFWIKIVPKTSSHSIAYIFLSRFSTPADVIKAYFAAIAQGLDKKRNLADFEYQLIGTENAGQYPNPEAFVLALRLAGWSVEEHLLIAGEYTIEIKRSG